ncbi:MAG: transcription antitermination factor NusB [Desulfovibrio sp.]|jgi:N utilization substance protein B|nr:transcription antitermination factor NusB [Desulfovibrio sp.]
MTGTKKKHRRAERVFAFKVLYGINFTPAASEAALLDSFLNSPGRPEDFDPEDSYAWELVLGIWRERSRLDEILDSLAHNWRVERMGKVEAAILRIALFELRQNNPEVPPKVAINEAVELSKQYGNDKSGVFVNGLLDSALTYSEKGAP